MLRGLIEVKAQRPTILYFNSFFSSRFTILPLVLWRIGFWGKPKLLLAPRGEFGDGALKRRSIKKRMYIAAFRLLGIHRSVIWHSTAQHETEDVRQLWGDSAKIVLRENDTLLPRAPDLPASDTQEKPLQLVFLGRIVEHKGLDILLRALARTSAVMSLDVFGPEEDAAYVTRCKKLVAQLPENVTVTFCGVLRPDGVRERLAEYDALFMPTAGENFGHVIAESLSVSCPVFATPFTPWTERLRNGGGVIVEDRDPESWRRALDRLAAYSWELRKRMRGSAAEAYRTWQSRPASPHVWSLAMHEARSDSKHDE